MREIGEIVSYREVTYHEIDRLIKEEYGRDFEFVADEEAMNDSDYSYSFKFGEQLDQWATNRLEAFKRGEHITFVFRALMQDMVNREVIPAGDYLITVCW